MSDGQHNHRWIPQISGLLNNVDRKNVSSSNSRIIVLPFEYFRILSGFSLITFNVEFSYQGFEQNQSYKYILWRDSLQQVTNIFKLGLKISFFILACEVLMF